MIRTDIIASPCDKPKENLLNANGSLTWLNGSDNGTIVTREEGKITVTGSGHWNSYVFLRDDKIKIPVSSLKKGTYYTMSIDIKLTNIPAAAKDIRFNWDFRTPSPVIEAHVLLDLSKQGEWVRYACSTQYPGDKSDCILGIRSPDEIDFTGAVIEYRNIKFEEGPVATSFVIDPSGKNILRGTNTVNKITTTGLWANGEWSAPSGGNGSIEFTEITDCPDSNITHGFKIVSHTYGNTDLAQNEIPYKYNTIYTVSCYARVLSGTPTLFIRKYDLVNQNQTPVIIEKSITNTEWQKFYASFSIPDISVSTSKNCSIQFGVAHSTGEIEICGMKLEEGYVIDPIYEPGEGSSSGGGGSTATQQKITLLASGWEDNFQQVINVPGVSADETAQLIIPTPIAAHQEYYYSSGILITAQGDNSLTFTTTFKVEVDIEVYIIIISVKGGN